MSKRCVFKREYKGVTIVAIAEREWRMDGLAREVQREREGSVTERKREVEGEGERQCEVLAQKKRERGGWKVREEEMRRRVSR